MTTTAFDDQFTPATQTILRVNVIESQQQIHDLQTRLAAAIERADQMRVTHVTSVQRSAPCR